MLKKITTYFMSLCLFTLMAMPVTARAEEALPVAEVEGVSGNGIGESEADEGGQQEENGCLKLSKTDEDTRDPLPGASFKIYFAPDSTEAGEMLTGEDGTAQASLAPGEYYIQEQCAPEGYQLSGKKYTAMVTAGETQEIAVTNKRLPKQEPKPETGTVRITKTDADRKDKKLPGAVFFVYEAGSGKKAGELLTGEDGIASLELPVGSYTIKETAAPKGYCLPDEMFRISLQAGGVEELSVTNRKAKESKEEPGAFRITKRDSEDGKRLKDAVFGIYDADTDNRMGEITTDRKGVAEIKLDPGSYYFLELEAPQGYRLDEEKIDFTVHSGQTTEETVINEKEEVAEPEKKEEKDGVVKDPSAQASPSPITSAVPAASPSERTGSQEKAGDSVKENSSNKKTGTLQVINAASGTGEKLSGQKLIAYGSDGKKAGELTVKDGKGTLLLPEGDYYLREKKSPAGFYGETARIRFSITEGLVTVVEINSERDLEHTNPQDIIPKTGESFPLLPWGLSAICFLAALLCGVSLPRIKRKQ